MKYLPTRLKYNLELKSSTVNHDDDFMTILFPFYLEAVIHRSYSSGNKAF